MKKFGWIFLFLPFLSGCASAPPTPLLSGVAPDETSICFSEHSQIPSIVERFFASRDLTTEEGKIDYLINRVRDSRVVFIRNREKYTSQNAAEFLRWKLNRLRNIHHISVETALDFVTQVTAGSRVSGEPYLVTFQDGSRYMLKDILENELAQLEMCLKTIASANTPPLAQGDQPSATAAPNPGR